MAPRTLTCAIYTRKSTEEGLDQPFNSLHAQRRACEDYIRSQVSEGWVISPVQYDDGGLSGGDLRRPALQRLISDIQAGLVDILVVYKVDRLTRALGDFAKLVEVFDRHGVSFVSVTQAFNTTTSMGRLTLNILLSFAQFEREITGERIRDKIAASKALGLWMGGAVPLGYDVGSERGVLAVNEPDAETVRLIFDKFLELGNTGLLQAWLIDEGIRSKRRITGSGALAGGYRFSRGALRHLLRNRIYVGEIVHRKVVHSGRHPAIVDRRIFDATQELLDELSNRHRNRITLAHRTLLNGIVFDESGAAMRPAFSRRQRPAKHYSYYASTPLPPGGDANVQDGGIHRVPTYALDELTTFWVAKLTQSAKNEVTGRTVRSLVARVDVARSTVSLVILAAALSKMHRRRRPMEVVREQLAPGEEAYPEPSDLNLIRVTLPIRLVPRGGRKWSRPPPDRSGPIIGQPDPRLVRDLRAGHAILRSCNIELDGFDRTLLRNTSAPKCGRDRRMARLAFLAPDIQQAILAGAPISYPTKPIPLSWREQRRLFGLGSTTGVEKSTS